MVLNHWWINFWQFLSQPEWEHVRFGTLHLVILVVNANAVYLSLSVFPCAITHCVCIPMLKLTHVHSRRIVPAFGTVFIGTVSVAWIERAGQLAADDVASPWTLWVQSPLVPRQFVGFFVGYRPLSAAREKKKTARLFMYVCVRACLCTCIYACLHVCLHASVSVRTHASTVRSNIYGEDNNILHKYAICKNTIHKQR